MLINQVFNELGILISILKEATSLTEVSTPLLIIVKETFPGSASLPSEFAKSILL